MSCQLSWQSMCKIVTWLALVFIFSSKSKIIFKRFGLWAHQAFVQWVPNHRPQWEMQMAFVYQLHMVISSLIYHHPDSKVHGAYMGPMWGRQDPGGPHVGPMNLAIRALLKDKSTRNIDTNWFQKWFYWQKMFVFRFEFPLSLFLMVQLTTS